MTEPEHAPSAEPSRHSSPPSGRAGRSTRKVVVAVLAALLVVGGVAIAVAVLTGDETAAPSTSRIPQPLPTVPASTVAQIEPPTIDASVPPPTAASATTVAVDTSDVLELNPLYSAGALQGVGCSAVSSVPLDSVDNVRVYYQSVLTCLDASWAPVGNDTGIPVRPAALEVFTGPSAAPCADGVEYSFYCSVNETIYMYADEMIQPWLQYPTDEYSHGITRLAATHTIAHEYGHHIQEFTGILPIAFPGSQGTEMERRVELQASCLANVFLASQASAYPIAPEYTDLQDLWRFITRVPNHGSEANQALWTQRGYQTATPGDCNTFSASAEEVG